MKILIFLLPIFGLCQKVKVDALIHKEITTTQRNALIVPSGEHYKIYNSTTSQYEYWDGVNWVTGQDIFFGSYLTDGFTQNYLITDSRVKLFSVVVCTFENAFDEIISFIVADVQNGSFKVKFSAVPSINGKINYYISK